MKSHPPEFALGWAALIIMAAGALIAWAISLDKNNPDWINWFRLVIAITVVLTGFCLIAKFSAWWIRH